MDRLQILRRGLCTSSGQYRTILKSMLVQNSVFILNQYVISDQCRINFIYK